MKMKTDCCAEKEVEGFLAETRSAARMVLIIGAILLILGILMMFAGSSKAATIGSGEIQSGGQARTFVYYVPDSYSGAEAVPLLVWLHGGGGSGWNELNKGIFQAEADATGAVVVYPDGLGGRWNSYNFDGQGVDDVGFVDDVVDSFEDWYSIDHDRLYLAGHSAGAQMVDTVLLRGSRAEWAGTLHYKGGWPVITEYCTHDGVACDPLDPCWSPLPGVRGTHVVVRGDLEYFSDIFTECDRLCMDQQDQAFWVQFSGCGAPQYLTTPDETGSPTYDWTDYDGCRFHFVSVRDESHETENAGLSEVWWRVLSGARRTDNTQAPPAAQCCTGPISDLNYYHATAGRARRDAVSRLYYALGSGDLLGRAIETTSLWESPMWNWSTEDCSIEVSLETFTSTNFVHLLTGRAFLDSGLLRATGSGDFIGAARVSTTLYRCDPGYFTTDAECR